MKKKSIISIFAIIVLLIITGIIFLKNSIFRPIHTGETVYIYVDKTRNYESVVAQLLEKADIPSEKIFRILADKMNYPSSVKTGRYGLKDGMSMIDIIRVLRSGEQEPAMVTFNNMRTKADLASRISQQLMIDSVMLLAALNDTQKINELGFTDNSIVAMFIPNTYEVYWDSSVDQFMSRMKREYTAFWNDERMKKADKIGLKPAEVSTLASIVEEEATYADEYPIVAGLYLNRIRKGMKLEADPTVKFAMQDFGLRRILFKHLETDSPYNTYMYSGLPPGPIRIPSISAIDAVLNPKESNYLFMCAKEDLSGRHNFAVTHAEHARNAARYQRALNEKKIY